MSLYWDLSDVFLMIRLRLLVLGRKTIEVKFYFHQPNIVRDVALDHPAEVVCQFLPPTVTLYSHLSILHSLESWHYEQPTLRKQELHLPPLRVEHLHKLFRIILHGRYVFSPYLFI